MRRQHSSPSMTGIITSHIIRSGVYFEARRIPSLPLDASIIRYSSQISSRIMRRMSSLSSIISRSGLSLSSVEGLHSMVPSSALTSSADIRFDTVGAAGDDTCRIGSFTVNRLPRPISLLTSMVPP